MITGLGEREAVDSSSITTAIQTKDIILMIWRIYIIWPASREKGPSDITNSVDQDQPLYDIENSYT